MRALVPCAATFIVMNQELGIVVPVIVGDRWQIPAMTTVAGVWQGVGGRELTIVDIFDAIRVQRPGGHVLFDLGDMPLVCFDVLTGDFFKSLLGLEEPLHLFPTRQAREGTLLQAGGEPAWIQLLKNFVWGQAPRRGVGDGRR